MNTLFQQGGLAATNIALRHETTSILLRDGLRHWRWDTRRQSRFVGT
jgi:hypothetical protein